MEEVVWSVRDNKPVGSDPSFWKELSRGKDAVHSILTTVYHSMIRGKRGSGIVKATEHVSKPTINMSQKPARATYQKDPRLGTRKRFSQSYAFVGC